MRFRMMRYFWFFSLFFPLFTIAQDWKLPVTSRVEKNDKPLEGAVVTLYKSGKQVDQKITSSDGKFRFELEPNGDYRLEVTKSGNVTKLFTFSTRGVPPEDGKDGFKGFDIKGVELFEPPEDCDVGFLKQPLIKVAYDQNTKNFEYDKAHSDQMLDALANVADCIEKAKAASKQFDKVMAEGASLMAKKDYNGAVTKFTQATQLKPKNEDAKTKLEEAKNMVANGAKIEADYKAAMDAGNAAMGSKNYQEAITQFTKAQGIKPSEAEPPKKIAEAQKLLAGAAADKDFNDAMQQGNDAVTAKDYQKAIDAYTKAKGLKPDRPEPQKKIDEVKALMAGAEAQKNYDAAMTEGNNAMGGSKWQDAITAYTKALTFKKGDPTATQKIADCQAKLKADADAAANEKKYTDAMQKGDAAMTATKWQDAINAYVEALGYKKDDPTATKKKADAEAKLKADADAKDLQAKFDAAIKKGDAAMTGKSWQPAIDAYTEALGYKKDDATAKQKLADAQAKLKADADAAANEKKYADAMKKGDDAMAGSKWQDAINAYGEALGIKSGDATATKKKSDAEAKLKEELGAKELQAKYDAAMKKGDAAVMAKTWQPAIDAYTEALSYKKDDATAKQKLADAQAKLKEELGAKELQAKYDAAMKKGDDAAAAKTWQPAIDAYTEALSYKKDDAVATKKKTDAEAKLKEELGAKEMQAKYDAAMKKGDDAVAAKTWQPAIDAYTEALTYKKDDATAKQKLADAQAKLKAELGEKELQAKYDDAMQKGMTALDGSKWQDAVNAFTEALTYKKDDATAKQKLADAQAKLKEELGTKELQAKFDAAVKRGDDAMAAKKYSAAVAAYTEALTYKANDATAKQKLADAQAKLKEEQDAKDLQAKFDAAMKKGNDAMALKKWSDAIAGYTDALAIKADDAAAKQKLADAEGKLKAEMGEKEMQAKYDAAVKKGDDAMAAKTWQPAIDAYAEALTYKSVDPVATKKKTDAEAKLKAENDSKEMQVKFDAAMKKGDDAVAGTKWQDAVTAYTEALSYKKDDATAKQKLADAQAKLNAELGDKALQAKFEAAMKKGDDAMAAKTWQAAVSAYTEALGYKKDDATAKQKLTDAQAKLKEEQDAKDALAKFTAAMKKGDDAMTAKKYAAAVAAYTEALTFKADDATAKQKLADAQEKLNAEAGSQAAYETAMKKGDDAAAAKTWQAAVDAYAEALSYKKADPTATKKKTDAEAQLKAELGQKELQAKFDAAMKKGDDAVAGTKWQDAVTAYTEALSYKKDDATAKQKLTDAQAKLNAELGDKALQAKYDAAIKKGDDAMAAKKYSAAVAAYTEALGFKKEDATAKQKLADAQAKLKEEQDAKDVQAKFDAAMKKGNDAMALKKWSDAVSGFSEALTIKADDATAKQKLAETQEKMNAELGSKEIQAKYDAAMKAGNDAKLAKEYEKAIENYNNAKSIKPEEKEPPIKIAEVQKIIDGLKEKETAFAKAMEEGKTFFEAKEYEKALGAYIRAKSLKEDHPDPPVKITEIQKILAELRLTKEANAKIDADYLKAMKEAKAFFDKKDYTNALEKYIVARDLKKEETEPPQKIEEINKLLEGDKLNESNYQQAMKEGDDAVAAKDYQKALEKYTHAKDLKPKAPEPPAKIAQVNKLMKEEADAKLKEQQYEAAMKEGIDDEKAKNWSGAIASFTKALTIKPGDEEATRRLKEAQEALKDSKKAEELIQKEKELDEKYKKEIFDGAAAMTIKDYKKALGHYTAANQLKPAEPVPPQKIEEINKILKQLEEEEKLKNDQAKLTLEYNKAMDDGNKAVLAKKYDVALDRFNHAKNLKPEEKDPPYKIAEVEELIRKQKEGDEAAKLAAEREAKYKEAFRLGMEGITKEDWNGAKAKFTEALTLKANDVPAKQKLDYVNQMLAKKSKADEDANYKAAIDRGNNNYKMKKYPDALSAFKEALKYKPNDPVAKQKIAELEKLVKPEDVVVNTQKRNPLLDKYPEGVTEETVNAPGCQITRRIVIKGEEAKLYEKKYYSFGTLQFFRDGVQITQSVFELETK